MHFTIPGVGCGKIDGLLGAQTPSKVFTGMCPFSKLTAEVAISNIMDGGRPDRPQEPGLTDSLWDVTRACWRQEPARRPAITKVVRTLREWPVPFLFTEPSP